MAKPRTVNSSTLVEDQDQVDPMQGAPSQGGLVSNDPADVKQRSPIPPMPQQGGMGEGLPGRVDPAQSRETPRERSMTAMDQPNSPTPMGGVNSVMPFKPAAPIDPASLVTPRSGGGLYGSLGGLKGGGLGVPLDPINDAQSDPLSALIQALMGRQ